MFLHRLSVLAPDVSIYGLVDFDPDGINILNTYRYGSARFSHLNHNLAVPRMQWIGVKSSDLFSALQFGAMGYLLLGQRERSKVLQMLEKAVFVEDGRELEWKEELQAMLMLNIKAEIQIMSEGGLEEWLERKMIM